MPKRPTVLVCVGATKAGTTWLHDYMSGHPDCALRGVKELHYFDAIDWDSDWQTGFHAGQIAGAEAQDSADLHAVIALIEAGQAQARGARAQGLDVDALGYAAWLDYLTDGSNAGGQEASVVADITPAYSLLTEARLRAIAGASEDVRILYILRDPVARLWSHVRMCAALFDRQGMEIGAFASRMLTRVTREGEEKHIADRGDYAAIVSKLKRAVPASKLKFAFYEEMITEAGIRDLCAFLGIRFIAPDLDRVVHEGVKIDMNEGQKRDAQDFLAPQYAFVEETFGRLPAGWRAEMARV